MGGIIDRRAGRLASGRTVLVLGTAAIVAAVLVVPSFGNIPARAALRHAIDPQLRPYAKLTPAPGNAVVLSSDGQTALVGGQGAVFVFVRAAGAWAMQARLEPPGAVEGDAFGCHVALSADGNTALIGAPGRSATSSQTAVPSATWVFTRTDGTWTPQAMLEPAAEPGAVGSLGCGEGPSGEAGGFGSSVALSGDGNTALVAAPGEERNAGAVWAYERSGSAWAQRGPKLAPPELSAGAQFGSSLAMSADGATALVGAPLDIPAQCRETGTSAGGVWTFAHTAGTWAQQGARLGLGRDCEGTFGSSVALSADGDTALSVGQWGAWPLTRSGSGWSLHFPGLPCLGEECGFVYGFSLSVALSGDGEVALVRATPEDGCGKYMNEPCGDRGLTWAFDRFGASWVQQQAGFEGSAGYGSGVALSEAGDSALIAEASGADAYLIAPLPPGSFSVAGLHARRSGVLEQQLASSTAGAFTVSVTVSRAGLRLPAGPARKLIRYGSGTASVSGPGDLTVEIRPRRLVRRALSEHRSIEPELHVSIRFTPRAVPAPPEQTLTARLQRR